MFNRSYSLEIAVLGALEQTITLAGRPNQLNEEFKIGEISPQLMDALGQYLNVDTDYLSGKYHRDAEKIKDEALC